jgi:hypothetical protein
MTYYEQQLKYVNKASNYHYGQVSSVMVFMIMLCVSMILFSSILSTPIGFFLLICGTLIPTMGWLIFWSMKTTKISKFIKESYDDLKIYFKYSKRDGKEYYEFDEIVSNNTGDELKEKLIEKFKDDSFSKNISNHMRYLGLKEKYEQEVQSH